MNSGLEDVVAAETILSDVDGAAGQLIIRGHSLAQLTGKRSFESVLHLLFDGFFEALPNEAELRSQLGAARADVHVRLSGWLPSLAALGPYDGVRAGIAMLPDGTTLEDALRLVAAPAVLLPAIVRLRRGDEAIAPDLALPHAGDMTRMLIETARPTIADALQAYLVTVCDHGLNASTFAARVVASTGAGLMSTALAGLGALKGPLHGGAPGPVLEMIDAITVYGDARSWLIQRVQSGERIMGFGHRIYRVRDPRADALKGVVRAMTQGLSSERLAFAEEVERTALQVLQDLKPHRALPTNVEFYTALLLEGAGFPADAFTGVFAAGRMTGWLAHAREQAMTGRLVRPRSHYAGPQVELAA